jgi:hypothetical protein
MSDKDKQAVDNFFASHFKTPNTPTPRTNADYQDGDATLEYLAKQIDLLQSELAALREDKARLDWLNTGGRIMSDIQGYTDQYTAWTRGQLTSYTDRDIRAAIDAARKDAL